MGYDHVVPEFIEKLLTDQEFTIYGDGTQTRSFCYVDDAVKALLKTGTYEKAANSIYNVGTQDEITINELAEQLFEIVDMSPDVEHIESKELSGSPSRRQPNIGKISSDLGYEPSVDLHEGLKRTYEWYRRDILG
jgi:nucleoside-diphosphate-sugar epimerase